MGDSLPRLSHVDAPFARHRMMPDRRFATLEMEEHMTDVVDTPKFEDIPATFLNFYFLGDAAPFPPTLTGDDT